MSQEPEDFMSPEEEAEIYRGAISGKVEADLDMMRQMVNVMREHPEDITPEFYSTMGEAISLYQVWMKQQRYRPPTTRRGLVAAPRKPRHLS